MSDTSAEIGFKKFVPGRGRVRRRAGLFKNLGLPARGEPLTRAIREGFPVAVVEKLANELGAPQKLVLLAIGIAPATLKRRREAGHLNQAESDRVYRLTRLYQQAIHLFEGDSAMARDWLEQPAKALGGRTPMAYMETEAGADEVEDLIGRLEHGVIA